LKYNLQTFPSPTSEKFVEEVLAWKEAFEDELQEMLKKNQEFEQIYERYYYRRELLEEILGVEASK